jgi:hypothetical protein
MACHDAVVPSPVARRQGSRLKHHRHAADAPGKKSGGGAHRGGRAAVGWRGAASAVAFHLRVAPTGWWRPWGGPVARGGGEGGDCGRGIREEKKTRCGGEKSRRRRQHLFKGVGGGESGDVWSGAREREGGPGCSKKWPGRLASTPSRRARAAALPRYSGGTRVARTCAMDRRDWVTTAPGEQR